jgi:DNA-binding MarR family transcriptional regulator
MRRAMRRVSQIYDGALGEVAASLVLDRSALAHNIKPLEREGLVELVADEQDKRNRLVALTEAGWAKLAQSMPLWEEAQRRFERAFGEERVRVFRATLDHIASPEFALRLD